MVSFTPYYNLGKPSGAVGGDLVDIAVENTNMDTIDTALHTHDAHLTSLDSQIAGLPGGNLGYVSLYEAANQTIANNVYTDLTWDNEAEDAQGFHAAGVASLVIPAGKAGLYFAEVAVNWNLSATGTRTIRLMQNANVIDDDYKPGAAATPYPRNRLATFVRCAVADVIKVQGLQTSGGNLDIIGITGGGSAALNHFKLTRLSD